MNSQWFEWFTTEMIFALKQASGMNDLRDKELVLGKIKALSLAGFRLSKVPPIIREMVNLEVIDLSNNKISGKISGNKFPENLTSIDLSNNNISTVDMSNSSARLRDSLVELKLDGNSLTSWPKGVGSFTSLRSLRIGYNKLETLSIEEGLPISLKDLYLRGNSIQSLDGAAERLASCFEVNVADNGLLAIPTSLFSGNLRVLNVSGNDLDDWDFLTEASSRGISIVS